MSERLALFAQALELSQLRSLPEEASALYAAFLRDALSRHQRPGRHLSLWRAGDLTHPFWQGLACAQETQRDEGLAWTLERESRLGDLLLLSADSPTLPPDYVDQGFQLLKEVPVVLGPTLNGSCYLIGLQEGVALPTLFEGMEWGSTDLLACSQARLEAAEIPYALLPPWYEVIHPEDLQRLEEELSPESHSLRALEQLDPNYKRRLEQIFGLNRLGEKLDLSGPRALEAALNHPLRAYRSVLIGGTNGKGSTAAFLEALLRREGLRVGLFSSPHLISYCERIRVDGRPILPSTVLQLSERVLKAQRATFFETTWGLAALAFAEAEVDIAIWEVGLGGRLDASNVCEPEVSGVVSLGLDHTAILGNTLAEIAKEKAGIFRTGRPALTSCEGEALEALKSCFPEVQAISFEEPLPPLSLPGAHQIRNAQLALAMARALGLKPDPEALSEARWPGRLERFGEIILDCAHNPTAAEALAGWLEEQGEPIHLIFGAMRGKDVAGLLAPLLERAESVAFVTPDYPRRLKAEELLPLYPWASLPGSVAQALRERPKGRLSLVTGSCFLVGEARALILGRRFPECGIRTEAR